MLGGFVIGDRGLGASGDTHPPWMMAYAVAGPYLVVGASAVGQIHLARNAPRDDAFVVRSAGPWLTAVVADGVGSRPYSRYGATYAVEALSSLLLRPLVRQPSHAAGGIPVQSSLPDSGTLAPPARVEQVDLRIGLVKVKSSMASLATGLRDWQQALVREERRPAGLLQTASIGWWPPNAPSQRSVVPESRLPSAIDPRSGLYTEPSGGSTSALEGAKLVEVMKQAFIKTHLGLREHARSLDLELADLSCTALALLLNTETGEGAVGQVGDGAILGLTAQGRVLELIQAPDSGDAQSTYTLNKPNFEQYLALGIIVERPPVDPFVAFYVMTDGVSGDLLYTPKPEALENWAQKVDYNLHHSESLAQAAAGMLNWLATYTVKGSWDDRTLVVITRQERRNGDRQPVAQQPGLT